MRPRDEQTASALNAALIRFSASHTPLVGIQDARRRACFIAQIVESLRRVKYVAVIQSRSIALLRADPSSELFDPLKAAIIHKDSGNLEEAFWLTFLFVHFGKGHNCGWRLVRDVYGRLGSRSHWDWRQTSRNPDKFIEWLKQHYETLKGDGVKRTFGNHRKYESLSPWSEKGTGVVVTSYVNWVMSHHSHMQLLQNAIGQVGNESRDLFGYLYNSMSAVSRFGRTARFDYLTMLAKLGLADLEPPSAYITGSTGPLDGARLLFRGNTSKDLSATAANALVSTLGAEVALGMQVLEDSLCNWQKSPNKFQAFRG